MKTSFEYEISELVAHAGRMSLLDRVLEANDTGAVAEVTIREDSLFYGEGGVGGWVGVEFMAQTAGAWAGWNARRRGEAPKIGFLLGTRHYECNRPTFKAGECLSVEVRQTFWAENGLGQFDCSISIDGAKVATAALTVFEPQETHE
ncbi:MAG: 3-hydroxylacyl-ACP dehydratase [Myxococcaceae bacterium]